MSSLKKVTVEQLETRRLLSLAVTGFNPANSTSALTNALLASASDINQSSAATYVGQNGQGGTYTGFNLSSGSNHLTIPDGIVLTSGSAAAAGMLPTNSYGTSWGTPGDSDLSGLIGGTTTNDANSLTLTFTVPAGTNSISFDLIFGSNEDPGGSFSDVFGAFLDGTQISFDNNNPIDVTNSVVTYHNDNTGLGSDPNTTSVIMPVGYGWLTPELATNAPLNTGLTTHTLKLAIADAGDTYYDSGVFLAGLTGSGASLSGPTTGAAGTFSVDQSTQTVTNTAGSVSVVVDRTNGSTGATSVNYATSDGTATAGTDYNATSGTLSFADGVTSQTITIPIDDNAGGAATSSFALTLSNPTGGASLGTSLTDTVTIQNNQSLVQLSSTTYSSADTAGSVLLTVNRTGNTTASATVNYATADGTAIAGTDYTATSGTLTFAAGVTSQTITVPVTASATSAASSNFTVTLSNPGGSGVLGTQTSSTVTETNPDSSVQFASTTYTFTNDAGTGLLTVDRTGNLASSATVQYATASGTALAGIDFTPITGTLTFAASQSSQTISIPLLENAAAAATSSFSVDLSSVGGNGVLGTQTVATITEQNNHSLLQFAASTFSVASTDASANLTVIRSGNISGSATVHYATSDGTAHAGSDYTTSVGTLTFSVGVSSETISVPLLVNPASTTAAFTVSLSTPGGSGLLGSQSSTQVAIGNMQSEVTFDSSAYAFNNTAGSAVLNVDRIGDSTPAASVDWSTSDQTAIAGVDYTAATGTLVFAAGQTTGTITVPVLANASGLATSTFLVTISNPGGNATLGTQSTSTVTLSNNQSLVQIPETTYSVGSTDTSVEVSVTRSGNIAQSASAGYTTADGTALAGADYTATTGVVNFLAGQSTATISIPLIPVSSRTSNTTFTVSLSSPGSSTVLGDRTSATVTIAGSSVVPVNPTPPVITIDAFADLVSATSPAATLHVAATESGSNGNLIYTWQILSQPSISLPQHEVGASSSDTEPLALFAINGTAAAKNTAVTFLAPGTYVFRVTASNGTTSTYSDVTVTAGAKTSSIPTDAATQVAGVQPISDGTTLSGFVVTFNGPLNSNSAEEIGGYKIVRQTTGDKHAGFFNRLFGTNPGTGTDTTDFKIASAVYDSSTYSVTLTLAKPTLLNNSTWQVQVEGKGKHAVVDANGKAIDGNEDGKAGGNFAYHMRMQVSKSITYKTTSGDTVHLSLVGAGKMITMLPAGSKTPTLFLTGTSPTASILTGVLHKSRKGAGIAAIHELNDSSTATIQLGSEFQVDLYGAA